MGDEKKSRETDGKNNFLSKWRAWISGEEIPETPTRSAAAGAPQAGGTSQAGAPEPQKSGGTPPPGQNDRRKNDGRREPPQSAKEREKPLPGQAGYGGRRGLWLLWGWLFPAAAGKGEKKPESAPRPEESRPASPRARTGSDPPGRSGAGVVTPDRSAAARRTGWFSHAAKAPSGFSPKRRTEAPSDVLVGSGRPAAPGLLQRSLRESLTLGEIWRGALWLLFSFLLGRTPFPGGTYPLALALVCAPVRRVGLSAFGVLAGALQGGGGVPMGIGTLLAMLLRILACQLTESGEKGRPGFSLREGLSGLFGFDEPLTARCAGAAVSAFCCGLVRIALTGYSPALLGSMIFSMVISPAAAWLYAGALDTPGVRSPRFEAGTAALLFSAAWVASGISFFGISVGYIFSFFVTLCVALQGGVLRGALTGLLCGLAQGVESAPILGLAGFSAGLLSASFPLAAPALAAGICLVGQFCFSGIWGAVGLVPETALSCLALHPLILFHRLPKLTLFAESGAPGRTRTKAALTSLARTEENERLESLSHSFGEISGVLYNLSDRLRRPGVTEWRRLCDTACDRMCPHCAGQAECWGPRLADTLDLVNKMVAQLNHCGRVTPSALSPEAIRRCTHLEEMAEEINHLSAERIESAVKSNKTEIFALDYEVVSKLLEQELNRNNTVWQEDQEMSRAVQDGIRGCDFPFSDIGVYGGRRHTVLVDGVGGSATGDGAEALRRKLEEICACRFRPAEFHLEGGDVLLSLKQSRSFAVEYARAGLGRENEDGNGDSLTAFENREDFFYALISDGMGSGSEAQLTSRLCTLFTQQMLSGGNSKALTLEMLHAIVREKGLECSSTMDLFELDLLTGAASFIKSGAAPSFVRRDGNLFRIQSKTMPLGLMRSLDAEETTFDTQPGDVVILLSDGIAQNFEEGIWLLELLTNGWDDDLDAMASRIVEHARLNTPRSDDATVCLIRIRDIR